MTQVSEQQETNGIVKYHELKRPLTKEEKREVRQTHILEIDDGKLLDKFIKSSLILLIAGGGSLSFGAMGVYGAQIATTAVGAFAWGCIGIAGFGATLGMLGKFGYDTYRYFSDRHRRIRALEQEKIKENTQRDSQELQRVREAKIAEAQNLRNTLYESQISAVEHGKIKPHLTPVSKTKNALAAKNVSFIKKQGRPRG